MSKLRKKELTDIPESYQVLPPDLQVGFHFRLNAIKDVYFHEALSLTIKKLRISDIDIELKKYVSEDSLSKLAISSLRGEAIFPVPLLLKENPFLLGYYRLLFGFSQKEFYTKGPFGSFKSMEEKGIMTKSNLQHLEEFCHSLIKTGELFITKFDTFSVTNITELQLLTVGPQFRGSKNNEYGQIATQKTFSIIKTLVKKYIESSTPTSIEIRNNSGRLVNISFSADPDIEIIEKLASGGTRSLISIEIKGGTDKANIHNRIGEAEKSHQKARLRGYYEFMTIISVDIDYNTLKKESPTTSHFFHLDRISDPSEPEFKKFTELLTSILGINTD
jgi:hypothetical protein